MSKWNHSMCASCWKQLRPGNEPTHITNAEVEVCCFCGAVTSDGIYVRHDPNTLPCGGKHEEPKDD